MGNFFTISDLSVAVRRVVGMEYESEDMLKIPVNLVEIPDLSADLSADPTNKQLANLSNYLIPLSILKQYTIEKNDMITFYSSRDPTKFITTIATANYTISATFTIAGKFWTQNMKPVTGIVHSNVTGFLKINATNKSWRFKCEKFVSVRRNSI